MIFVADHDISAELKEIDGTAAYWRKPGNEKQATIAAEAQARSTHRSIRWSEFRWLL